MRNDIFILFAEGSLCGIGVRLDPLSPTAWELPPTGSLDCAQTEAPTHKADSRGRLSLQKKKMRAGRRARDEIWVLPAALRGEKSVIGGIGNPSEAPHLHRKFLREVRSEFLWTVDGASGRSSRRFVCFFCNFSFKQRKVYKTPKGEMGFVRSLGVRIAPTTASDR